MLMRSEGIYDGWTYRAQQIIFVKRHPLYILPNINIIMSRKKGECLLFGLSMSAYKYSIKIILSKSISTSTCKWLSRLFSKQIVRLGRVVDTFQCSCPIVHYPCPITFTGPKSVYIFVRLATSHRPFALSRTCFCF